MHTDIWWGKYHGMQPYERLRRR